MAQIFLPLGSIVDDAGAIVAGATVTIASVKSPIDDSNIAAHGATVALSSDGLRCGVLYDVAAKGEAWITLAVSKAGSTFSGSNASPVLFASSDPQSITSRAVPGDAMTLVDNAITAAKIATNAIDADALATDAVAEIADAVWDEALAGHVAAGSAGKALADAAVPVVDVVRGPLSIYIDGTEGATQEGDILYVGEMPTLMVRVLDRVGRPTAVAAPVTGSAVRTDTGAVVGGSIACTVRDAALGIVEVPIPSAVTDAALAGKRLRLTLSWQSASRTNIAGAITLEIKSR
jgi:hypothetical protein